VRSVFFASVMVILTALSVTSCSGNSSKSSDNSSGQTTSAAADTDTSNKAAPAPMPVFPRAQAVTPPDPSKIGAGGKMYTTKEPLTKVESWYVMTRGAQVGKSSPASAMMLIGDRQAGTAVILTSAAGKTWIVLEPASSLPQH
jgi:hypothetical protein